MVILQPIRVVSYNIANLGEGAMFLPTLRFKCATAIIGTTLIISACSENKPAAEDEVVRAIKPYYVSEPAGSDIRKFSGIIEAADVSTLSFNVSGTVQTVYVSAGETVATGQELASLDPEPFNIDVTAAEAELETARAALVNKKADLDRQTELYDKGWVTKATLDQVQLAYESAQNEVTLAQSRLNTAIRNLNNATLRAPFDGVLADRIIDPFTEISVGQNAFLINSQGALEANFLIADSSVSRLTMGQAVSVSSNAVPACGCTGRITEIGSAADAANAVLIKASLIDPPTELLPGMAADITLALANQSQNKGYLVPLVAISPSDKPGGGVVFKYDEASGTVLRTEITGIAGRDNYIAVTEGVAAGDILAAAGVSFLRDGQKVKLLRQ